MSYKGLVETSKLTSLKDAQEIVNALKTEVLCRPNLNGDLVKMKSPLKHLAKGIRTNLKSNKRSAIPKNFDPSVLENDEKLVLACLSMFQC
jgi:hypothetical protein